MSEADTDGNDDYDDDDDLNDDVYNDADDADDNNDDYDDDDDGKGWLAAVQRHAVFHNTDDYRRPPPFSCIGTGTVRF